MEIARFAFEMVVGARTSFLVRTNALLELMELESSVGQPHGVRAAAGRGGEGADRMPPSMLTDFYYKAGVGLARFGQAGAGAPLSRCRVGARRDPPTERVVFPVRERPGEPDGL